MLGTSNKNFPARGFSTPPPPPSKWRRWSPESPVRPFSEKKPQAKPDLFHVIHKVPAGDSPYVRAKHVQLIEKDPSRAISLFWAAINSGDRVDSALKDMAVVMKQLDRSDEAVEAIKSFRHLCPLESQESIDNLLVELYKRSGRIEDQIEMLQHKVKTIEEGIAFGGKRTKSARSQGKKVQITVEQEYSRLLGNLAWAHLQQNNFKSAEELYRKALSFEVDKNKQCNLAICLMHTGRMTEAKLLLQTIRASSIDGQFDDSYLRSYERATEVLTELESNSGVGYNKENCSESSPQTSFVDTWKKGSYTENPYANFNKKAYYASPIPAGGIQKVPFTQPRRCLWSSNHGDQRRAFWGDPVGGGCSRKLSFEQTMTYENFGGKQPAFIKEMSKAAWQKSESGSPSIDGDWRKSTVRGEQERNYGENDGQKNLAFRESERQTESHAAANHARQGEDLSTEERVEMDSFIKYKCANPPCKSKKSWADMVEEEESNEWNGGEEFNNENVDSNIVYQALTPLDQIEKLSQKIEYCNLKDGYYTQPSMNKTSRRSLCFEGNDNSLLLNEREGTLGNGVKLLRRNRLQVFRDITVASESPRQEVPDHQPSFVN